MLQVGDISVLIQLSIGTLILLHIAKYEFYVNINIHNY